MCSGESDRRSGVEWGEGVRQHRAFFIPSPPNRFFFYVNFC
jgi:hypothetical protein